jgi:hypothetical protein
MARDFTRVVAWLRPNGSGTHGAVRRWLEPQMIAESRTF